MGRIAEAIDASFEFVTDGRLGPTGQKVADALEAAGSGRSEGLAALMGEEARSPVCNRTGRRARCVWILRAWGHMLARAERQVQRCLPTRGALRLRS